VPGSATDDIQDLLCGTTSRQATSGQVQGLSNGVSYNLAVAAVDSYDNVGVLSPVACQAPAASPSTETASPSDVMPQTAKACSLGPGRPSLPLVPIIGISLCLLRRRRRARHYFRLALE